MRGCCNAALLRMLAMKSLRHGTARDHETGACHERKRGGVLLYAWCFEQLDTPRQTYSEIDFFEWKPKFSSLQNRVRCLNRVGLAHQDPQMPGLVWFVFLGEKEHQWETLRRKSCRTNSYRQGSKCVRQMNPPAACCLGLTVSDPSFPRVDFGTSST